MTWGFAPLILLLLVQAAHAQQPASRPVDPALVKAREQHRTNWERTYAGATRVDDITRLADVVRFEMRDGVIVAVSHYRPDGPANLSIKAELPGFGPVAFNMAGRRDGKTALTNFSLNANSYDEPNAVVVTTIVSVSGGAFSFNVRVQTTAASIGVTTSLQVREARAIAPGMPRVTFRSSQPGQPTATTQADNINLLFANNRTMLDRQLRPALRRVGAEAILAPDATTAWQVFIDGWTPDPALQQRVTALLPALNDDDFTIRERAAADLEKLGRDGALAAFKLDRKPLTPQQNALIDRLLTPYFVLAHEDVRTLREDRGFLTDCLLVSDPVVVQQALGRLRKLTGKPLPFDPALTGAERDDAIERIRAAVLAR